MKKFWIVTGALLMWTTFACQNVRAADDHVITSDTWHHGARISGGLQVRTWEASFRATGLAAPPARGMRQRDIGHRGLYPGEGDIHYIDGSIFEAPEFFDGAAHFTVPNQAQIGPAPHLDDSAGSSQTITFSSLHAERPRTRHEAMDSSGSSDETVLVPFVLLERPFVSDEEGWSLYGAFRYAFGRGTIDRGARPFSRTVHQQRTVRNLYTYDASHFTGDITAPFDSRDQPEAGIIYDPGSEVGQQNPDIPWNDPVQRSTQSVRRQSYTGWSTHEIDIEQHEFLLGGSAELPVADRVSVSVLAGVTLSYVDWTFKTDAWFVNDAGQAGERRRFSRGDNKWLWGATCQVQALVDVTEDGRYFAVLDGGYNWVDDFNARNDVSSARVQLDSWVVSGAVGLRL